MALSEQSQFRIFLVLAALVGAGLIYRDRHKPDLTLAARAQWSSAGISSYRYTVFYYGIHTPPMDVLVTHGVVESANLYCPPRTESQCHEWQDARKDIYGPDKLPSHAETVSQLFDRITATRGERGARIVAEFDPVYGYPSRFSFDDPWSEDEEWGFEISQFAVIQ